MAAHVIPISQPIDGLFSLPLSSIRPSPMNPRKHFDPGPLKELAESIKTHGVQQPVLVRQLAGKLGMYELVVGERRWRASKLAGKDQIPAIARELTDTQALEIMILENLQRQDVHPLDEALGYQALLKQAPDPKAAKPTVESIAGKVGKSASYVYQRLKLAELAPKAQEEFRTGFLTAAHAIDMARLQPADQVRALEYCHRTDYGQKRTQAPPFRDLRQWIQENVQLNLDKAPFDVASVKLLPSAGACTDCPKRSGSNPMLFEGMGKNTCTDPACYQAKKMALVNINLDAIETKQGVKPILISHCYSPDRGQAMKGVLYEEKYRSQYYSGGRQQKITKDSCKGTRLAVYVDEEEFGDNRKAGDTIYVCLDRNKCQVHSDQFNSRGSSGEGGAAARRNQRISRHYKAELFKAVAGAIKQPTRADRELVAYEFFKKLGHYQETPLIAALGWDPKLTGWGFKTQLRKKITDLTDTAIATHLILFAIASDLASSGNGGRVDRAELIEAVAKRHGVKSEKYLAEAKAKFTKKAKVQTSAKKVSK